MKFSYLFKSGLLISLTSCLFGINTMYANIENIKAPSNFVTHNKADGWWSNARLGGRWAPSGKGTPPLVEKATSWFEVKTLCLFRSPCEAEIYMQHGRVPHSADSNDAFVVAKGSLDLATGIITPGLVIDSEHGFKLHSPEPGKMVIELCDADCVKASTDAMAFQAGTIAFDSYNKADDEL